MKNGILIYKMHIKDNHIFCIMKTIFDVFDNNFTSICNALEDSNFRGSVYCSTELIRISDLLGFEDGILIGEILESTINQLSSEIGSYEIPKEEKAALMASLITQIKIISNCYKNENKNELFAALQKFRNLATKFQYNCRRNYKSTQKRFDPLEILRR